MECNFFKEKRGFTLIEILVGASIFVIIFFGLTLGFQHFLKRMHINSTLNTSQNTVDSIIENIRQSFSNQVITLDQNPSLVAGLNDSQKLPMAWSLYEDVPVSECPKCPGRYGYIVQSIGSYSGLYLVTVQFTHTDWTAPRKYEFIVGR